MGRPKKKMKRIDMLLRNEENVNHHIKDLTLPSRTNALDDDDGDDMYDIQVCVGGYEDE
jgi:hypothetical protein